ncbi:MAG: hypothetical protein JXL97_15675 [Bacteroidales bacterium]|nr:hypothetical protein [Bacteroidales bacterium]
MNLLSKLYKYQKERFPLQILIFTTISSVLASATVTNSKSDIKEIILVFLSAIFFLFHVRVIDESRDAEYDKKFYPDRPVQTGFISIRELFFADFLGLAFFLIVAVIYGNASFILALAMLLFTTLAWKDFFLQKFFLNKPMLYHIINSPQMIMLQLFIFAIFTDSFSMTKSMWLLAGLAYINIFVLEVIRKIKRPDKSGKAGDVYTKSLGFKGALIFTLFLTIISGILFVLLLNELNPISKTFLISGISILTIFIFSILGHLFKKSKTTEKVMLLAGVILYVGLNIVVYLSV